MKKGIDVSHWNNLADIWSYPIEFMFAKLTEGKSIKDWTAYQYYSYAQALEIPFGVYHFAHPESNTVEDEYEHFLNYFKQFNNKNIAIALDVEAKALQVNPKILDEWAYRWMNLAKSINTAPVYLYIQQSACKLFEKCTEFPLWVARYRKEEIGYGDVTPWKKANIWQYDSKLVDKNIMY